MAPELAPKCESYAPQLDNTRVLKSKHVTSSNIKNKNRLKEMGANDTPANLVKDPAKYLDKDSKATIKNRIS